MAPKFDRKTTLMMRDAKRFGSPRLAVRWQIEYEARSKMKHTEAIEALRAV